MKAKARDILGELFEKTTTAMLLADDERRYVAANSAACEALGIDLETLLEMRIEDLAAPDLRPLIADQWAAFIEAGSQSGPYRLEVNNGRTLDVVYSATANVVPGLHLSVFVQPELADPELDLADGRAGTAQEESGNASDPLEQLVANSTTAMLVVDDDRRYVCANEAFMRLLHATEEDLEPLMIDDVIPEPLKADVIERFLRLLKEGSQWGPVQLTTLAGDQIAVIYSATANILPGRHLIEMLHGSRREPEFNFSHPKLQPANGDRALSPREREVLTLLALGDSNQTIASKLHLSPETVRNHTRSARYKLGAKSRSHAIAIAIQTNQLDLDDQS